MAAAALFSSAASLTYTQRPVTVDGGGWVTGIAAHAASGLLYCRTDVGGAYRSDDGGASWVWLSGAINGLDVWSTRGLALNESDATGLTVLVAVGGRDDPPAPGAGVWKSTDGGSSWRQTLSSVAFSGNGDARQASPALVVDEARPWRVWAAAQRGLFLSVDGGESFAPVASFNARQDLYNGSDSSRFAMAFVALVPPRAGGGGVDPALAGHVVVAAKGMRGLAVSTDDGATWALAAANASLAQPWRLLRYPNGTSFLGTDNRVLRVTAGPGGWADVGGWQLADRTPRGPAEGSWMSVDAPLGFADGAPLVVASSYQASLYTSADGGLTWRGRNTTVAANFPVWWTSFPGNQFVPWGRNGVVVSSRAPPGTWLIASGFGVLASRDEGDSWAFSSGGIGEVCVLRCHSHPVRAGYTFCGAEDLTGFTVADGGASGRAETAVFAREPAYWAVDFGKGAAWTDPASGSRGLSFAGDAQMDGEMGQWITWPDPAQNVSFSPIRDVPGALNNVSIQLVDLFQSPDDPLDLLLVGAWGWFGPWNASMPPWAYSGGVVRSRDGGASWQHVKSPPPSGFGGITEVSWGQIQADGGDPDARWWALCNIGIFVSRDRGETWNETTDWMWSLQAVAPDAVSGAGAVFALVSTNLGWAPPPNGTALRRTRDFGATWDVLGNFSVYGNAPGFPFPCIAAHASGRVAVLANGPGDALPHVWVSVDAGLQAWTVVDDAARGEYLAPGVTGLHFDAHDATLLYVSTGGRSLVVVKLDQ